MNTSFTFVFMIINLFRHLFCQTFALLPFQAGVWFLLGCGYSNVSFSPPCFDVVSYKPHECGACVSVRRILFPGIPDGFFSRMEIEIVTCFVIFSPRWMSLESLFLIMVCMTIWVRQDCLSYEQYF